VMLWGRLPDWSALGAYLGVSLAVMYAGRAWFMATRRGFADVL
jgi:lipopolysaccharide transport system permease protein